MCKYEEPINTPEELVEVFNRTAESLEKSNENVMGFFESYHIAYLNLKRLKDNIHLFEIKKKKETISITIK